MKINSVGDIKWVWTTCPESLLDSKNAYTKQFKLDCIAHMPWLDAVNDISCVIRQRLWASCSHPLASTPTVFVTIWCC